MPQAYLPHGFGAALLLEHKLTPVLDSSRRKGLLRQNVLSVCRQHKPHSALLDVEALTESADAEANGDGIRDPEMVYLGPVQRLHAEAHGAVILQCLPPPAAAWGEIPLHPPPHQYCQEMRDNEAEGKINTVHDNLRPSVFVRPNKDGHTNKQETVDDELIDQLCTPAFSPTSPGVVQERKYHAAENDENPRQ